jgi:hypothetical protein
MRRRALAVRLWSENSPVLLGLREGPADPRLGTWAGARARSRGSASGRECVGPTRSAADRIRAGPISARKDRGRSLHDRAPPTCRLRGVSTPCTNHGQADSRLGTGSPARLQLPILVPQVAREVELGDRVVVRQRCRRDGHLEQCRQRSRLGLDASRNERLRRRDLSELLAIRLGVRSTPYASLLLSQQVLAERNVAFLAPVALCLALRLEDLPV